MGDILKKITEILNDGADFEQSRSTGIIIKSKLDWFGAIDGQGTSESNPAQAEGVGDTKERISKT